MRNMNKVVSTLHQFVRDWSTEGKKERDEVYKPILDAVVELVPIKPNTIANNNNNKEEEDDDDNESSQPPRVLCPGSGLCRLPFEFAAKGYTSQVSIYLYIIIIIIV